jgi:hypothetical protein
VLDEGRRLRQAAVILDRQYGNAAAAVIRHEQVLPGFIQDQMTRPAATRGNPVEQGELTRRRVDRKSADETAFS